MHILAAMQLLIIFARLGRSARKGCGCAGLATAILAACMAAYGAQAQPAALGSATGAQGLAASHPMGDWRDTRRARLPGPYSVQVLGVIDGDSFVARVPVWIGQDVTTHVRLRGVDAPEIRGRCAAESQLAAEAKQALADILGSGRIEIRDIGTGKYAGRVIARVFVTSQQDRITEDAGRMLMAAGYARPYRGGRRNSWCSGQTALRGGR